MGELQRTITNLMDKLDKGQKEVESQAPTMHQLQACLDEQLKTIIHGNLDRLLIRAREEAARITERNINELSAVVLIAPEGRVTVEEVYGDQNSDPRLMRLKSQGFSVTTLAGFSSLIQSLKGDVTERNWVPTMEFLRVNAKSAQLAEYWLTSNTKEIAQPTQASTSSKWKPSDFLPAPFPQPPLPRGLFRH